jgi:hypothetical protein
LKRSLPLLWQEGVLVVPTNQEARGEWKREASFFLKKHFIFKLSNFFVKLIKKQFFLLEQLFDFLINFKFKKRNVF